MRRELALAIALSACSAPAPAAGCPSGTHEDSARAAAIDARLATVPAGRALVDAARGRVSAVCFGSIGSANVITVERVIVLAQELEEGEAAARLGHLLVHVRDGLPIDALHPPCDAAVERAMSLEARAYVEEIALQDALGAHPTSLAFEFADAVRAAVPEAREAIALAYLRAHPEGGPGIDGLESAYRAQCR